MEVRPEAWLLFKRAWISWQKRFRNSLKLGGKFCLIFMCIDLLIYSIYIYCFSFIGQRQGG